MSLQKNICRMMFAEPIRSKTGKAVAQALVNIFTRSQLTPASILSDAGLVYKLNVI
jgi:hypothetical protein